MPETPPPIETIEDLRIHLQTALWLEHATIPPYLTALYSLKDGGSPVAHSVQSVLMEEMLHLALAANVLNAVGGAPVLNTPDFIPTYPVKLPVGREQPVEVGIRRFSPEAIATFLAIEYPRRPTAALTEAAAEQMVAAKASGELSAALKTGDLYASIGDFYEAIQDGLRRLEAAAQVKGETIFTGPVARQAPPGAYYGGGGRLLTVTDLASAQAALAEIVDQGEGYGDTIGDGDDVVSGDVQDHEVAHYYRFNEIAIGRRYGPGDKPDDPPSGPPLAVDYSETAVWPMVDDPAPEQYGGDADLVQLSADFTASYNEVLQLLHRGFNGEPDEIDSAVSTMTDLPGLAALLLERPIPGGTGNAGPCFRAPN